MMKSNVQSFSLEKIMAHFDTEEVDKETFKSTFIYEPKASKVKRTNVTLTFKRFLESDALALAKLEIDKKTDVNKIMLEIEKELVAIDLFNETCRFGHYLVKADHNFRQEMFYSDFFYYAVFEELSNLELVVKDKKNEFLFLSPDNELYFRSTNVKDELENEEFGRLFNKLNRFGEDIKIQESGDVYVKIGNCSEHRYFGIFESYSSKVEVSFQSLRPNMKQGKNRYLWTLEDVIASGTINKKKEDEYREIIDANIYPMKIEGYTIYKDFFIGKKKEPLSSGDWIQMEDGIYKVYNLNSICTNGQYGSLALHKLGDNPFWGGLVKNTMDYEVIQAPKIKNVEKPFICEASMKMHNGLIFYGEVLYESDVCYYVKPYFVDDSNYFEVIEFMAKNVLEAEHYFKSFSDKLEKQNTIFDIYHLLTEAPYQTIAISKDLVKVIDKKELKGINCSSYGYNVQEKLCSLHLKNSKIPLYLLDNLIIKENIGNEELVKLATLLVEPDLFNQLIKDFERINERNLHSILEFYPVETHQLFHEYLTKEII